MNRSTKRKVPDARARRVSISFLLAAAVLCTVAAAALLARSHAAASLPFSIGGFIYLRQSFAELPFVRGRKGGGRD
jgi:hypothetical protein